MMERTGRMCMAASITSVDVWCVYPHLRPPGPAATGGALPTQKSQGGAVLTATAGQGAVLRKILHLPQLPRRGHGGVQRVRRRDEGLVLGKHGSIRRFSSEGKFLARIVACTAAAAIGIAFGLPL